MKFYLMSRQVLFGIPQILLMIYDEFLKNFPKNYTAVFRICDAIYEKITYIGKILGGF